MSDPINDFVHDFERDARRCKHLFIAFICGNVFGIGLLMLWLL